MKLIQLSIRLSIYTIATMTAITSVSAQNQVQNAIHPQNTHPIVLQSVHNLEQFKTTEGNSIKLIKLNNGCQFEAIFYGEIGKTVEYYTFRGNQLLTARILEYSYSFGGLTNLTDNHGKFDTILDSSASYETHLPATQNMFQTYRSLFPTAILQQCQ